MQIYTDLEPNSLLLFKAEMRDVDSGGVGIRAQDNGYTQITNIPAIVTTEFTPVSMFIPVPADGIVRLRFDTNSGTAGESTQFKNMSLVSLPNAGTYTGFPTDFSNIKTFKKKGDDWFGANIWNTGNVVFDGSEPGWTYVGGGNNLLDIGVEYEVEFTVDSISGGVIYMISGGLDVTPDISSPGVYTARFVATSTACKMRNKTTGTTANVSNILLKRIIKGA